MQPLSLRGGLDVLRIGGEVDAGRVVAELTAVRRRNDRRLGLALMPVGLAVILVALFAMKPASTWWQLAVFLVGLAVLWYGGQLFGRSYNPRFRLGNWVAGIWVALVVVVALTASILPIEHYDAVVGESLGAPKVSFDEPLGYDDFGRSELSRVAYGGRVAFTVGGLGAGLGLLVGGFFGLLAGFYRGKVDGIISIVGNAILAFPPLALLLAVVALFERSTRNLSLALALITVPTFMRLTRAQTLVSTRREYVLAARAMGAKNRRIIFREILPNVILPVASYTFLVMALLIVAEGSLSFVGVGIQPPNPSWGGMIAKAQDRLKTAPHAVFVPATAMFLTVLALNRVGEWARRAAGAQDAGRL